jgi:hypothetical protein
MAGAGGNAIDNNRLICCDVDDPIPLPGRRELLALRDAADYSYAVCSWRNQERHSYCLQVAAAQTNAGNEKAAGIFAPRPPGLKLIGLINADPPAPVLREWASFRRVWSRKCCSGRGTQ